MTKNLAREVRKDVDDQMQAIDNLITAIHTLHKQAESTNDQKLLETARRMAAEVRTLSEKAYRVGTKVLDNAA